MPPVQRFLTTVEEWQAERDYLDCSVFGRAASWARAAIHASYSGVPRRGGTPEGMPPIQCGMSAIRSPAVFPPAQDDSTMHARHSKAQSSNGGNRFIRAGCHGNVAVPTRNQGRDGTTQVPLTMSSLASALVGAAPGRFARQFFRPECLLTNGV